MMVRVKRTTRTPTSVALAVTATLALAGCSGLGMSEGAVIDGTAYSIADVQEAAAQLSQVSAEPVDVQTVIYEAGVIPLLEPAFVGTPYEATESVLRGSLAEAGLEEEASDLTLEAATFRHYGSVLSSPEAAADPELEPVLVALQSVTQEDIAALPVEVNPRFGAWDASGGGVVPQVPAWIQSSDS